MRRQRHSGLAGAGVLQRLVFVPFDTKYFDVCFRTEGFSKPPSPLFTCCHPLLRRVCVHRILNWLNYSRLLCENDGRVVLLLCVAIAYIDVLDGFHHIRMLLHIFNLQVYDYDRSLGVAPCRVGWHYRGQCVYYSAIARRWQRLRCRRYVLRGLPKGADRILRSTEPIRTL